MTNFFPSSGYLLQYFLTHDEYSGYYKGQWFRVRLTKSGLWLADVHASLAGRGLLTDVRLDALLLKIYQKLEDDAYVAI